MSQVLFVHAKGGPPVGPCPVAGGREVGSAPADAQRVARQGVAADAARLCASVLSPVRAERRDLVVADHRPGARGRGRGRGRHLLRVRGRRGRRGVRAARPRAGPGAAAALARDKRMMRAHLGGAGRAAAPVPRPSPRRRNCEHAAARTALPAAAEGRLERRLHRAPDHRRARARRTPAWSRSREVMAESAQLGFAELHVRGRRGGLPRRGDRRRAPPAEWFDGRGWGDYVSVEGVVVGRRLPARCASADGCRRWSRSPSAPASRRPRSPEDAQERIVDAGAAGRRRAGAGELRHPHRDQARGGRADVGDRDRRPVRRRDDRARRSRRSSASTWSACSPTSCWAVPVSWPDAGR